MSRRAEKRAREALRFFSPLLPRRLSLFERSNLGIRVKGKASFFKFLSSFPLDSLSLRPRLFVVSRRHPSRLLDHGNRPRGLRPEGNEEGGLLHWNKSYTKDSGVVTQKFDSARNSIVTSWPVVTSLCVKSRSSSFPLSPLILHRPIRHQDPNQPLSRLVTPSYIRP